MDKDANHYRRYYEELRGTEHAKNTLIEDLIQRLDIVTQEYQQESLDKAREAHYNREVQLRELQLQDELRKIKAMVERDAFVLLLIDGDGMIFDDRLIQAGEAGGKEAASMLWTAVRDYVHQQKFGLPSDFKIVTRIYANLKGLGDVCHRAGILDGSTVIEDFARGFTGSKQFFDFVDVGTGKDRADDKISELFKLHLYNCHCRHIIFGCSHDNGYARLLEDIADRPMLNQITLLEGVPFERELAMLKSKYESTKFESLFRTSKINVYQQQFQQPVRNQTMTQPIPLPTPQLTQQSIHYQSPYQPVVSRSSSASITNSMNPMAVSWASTAISTPPAHVASPPPTPTPQSSSSVINVIPRNKYGQRVDSSMQYDKSEMKRVQKLHMCNVHFLRGDCLYGDECTHDHYYKPNKNELQTLKYITRQTPCRFGPGCDDTKCIYGHRCPTGTEGSKKCLFGDACRFDLEMHGIDTTVVRTTKVS
ncbi:hypothetical protein MMC06_000356 [Schaereria dolodes]|nr:hypothetical protein [Schaereria dolodes]